MSPSPNLKAIWRLYLPLALSFELMMLEGPAVFWALGRLPETKKHLAAFGLTFSLQLLIESPVIMLLATAVALVSDRARFAALRTFMLRLAGGCTLLAWLCAFTPLYDLIVRTLMNQPPAIAEAARFPMQLMLFWSAAIAWRRTFQGVLVRFGHTKVVTWGTALRLVAVAGAAALLPRLSTLPGAAVGAVIVTAGVLVEAAATTAFARPVLRRELPETLAEEPPLTQAGIWRFHLPLAVNTLLGLSAQPLTSAALAHLPAPTQTLAAWPVVFSLLLILRGWGFALQEITVAQMKRSPAAARTLLRFSLHVGAATTAAALLLPATPLLGLYCRTLKVPPDLLPLVRLGVLSGALLPLLAAIGSWIRGLLMATGCTGAIYGSMALALAAQGAILGLGVALQAPGMATGAAAFTLSCVAEFVYLCLAYRRSSRSSNAPSPIRASISDQKT